MKSCTINGLTIVRTQAGFIALPRLLIERQTSRRMAASTLNVAQVGVHLRLVANSVRFIAIDGDRLMDQPVGFLQLAQFFIITGQHVERISRLAFR